MSILKLATANILKRKSASFSLFMMILISVMLFNIGLTIMMGLNPFYDNKSAELSTPDFICYMPEGQELSQTIDLVTNYEYTDKAERQSILVLKNMAFAYNGQNAMRDFLLLNGQTKQGMHVLKLVESLENPDPASVYLPLTFSIAYQVGDMFEFSYDSHTYNYQIAGFFEDAITGNLTSLIIKMYLSDAAYQEVALKEGDSVKNILLSATLTDTTKAIPLSETFFNTIGSNDKSIFEINYFTREDSKLPTLSLVSSMSMVIIAFSLIMLIVALLVTRFQIVNSIQENMKNIAILKSIGYTSKKIVSSMIAQYLLIAVVAFIPGIIFSILSMPIISKVIASSMGLIWILQVSPISCIITLLLITLLVLLLTFLTSMKSKNVTPVSALRRGNNGNLPEKNHWNLSRSNINVNMVLSIKSLFREPKQNFVIAVIVLGLTFACTFTATMYYNFAVDESGFLNTAGMEMCQFKVARKPNVSNDLVNTASKEIESMIGVNKILLLDEISASAYNTLVWLQVADDFSQVATDIVAEGRYPQAADEIVISYKVSQLTGKKIGDKFEVSLANNTQSYTITGICQTIYQFGLICPITTEGVQRLDPSYELRTINVYLDENVSSETFSNMLLEIFGDQFYVQNFGDIVNIMLSSFSSTVFVVLAVIILFTIFMIALILNMMIKILITKRQQEYGILKAIGYMNSNIILQIVLSFIPVVIFGVLIGAILGSLYSRNLFALLLSSIGIFKSHLNISIPYSIILCIGIIVASYIILHIASRRIKKVSVYGLLSE